MIKKISVTNYLGEKIELELTRPDLSGLVVKSISGLGPATAHINTTKVASFDGSTFNSARLNERNIVLTLLYYETDEETIEDVRQKTYKYFPEKKKLKFVIDTDNRSLQIEGYVEKNEATIFSKSSGCTISIICPDPYWYGDGEDANHSIIFNGVESMFEFPFQNNSLTENLIEMSVINNLSEKVVTYNGDSEIGVTISMHALGEVRNVTIYNTLTRETMILDTDILEQLTGHPIIKGDTITISTVKGNKSAKLLRNAETYNILNCIRRGSDWFTLSKGDNIFAYIVEYGIGNLQFRIDHKVRYDGV